MAGGSQIIISSDGITIKTPREFKVFAAQHNFESGQAVASKALILPLLKEYDNSQKFKIVDENETPLHDLVYLILDHNNQAHIGNTDKDGYTKRIFTPEPSKLKLFYGIQAMEKMKQLRLK